MTPTPTAASLVERFKLKERGRDRGRDGHPTSTQPTLDNVEMEVVDHCNDLYATRRNEYHRDRAALEERMSPAPANRDAKSLAEQGCKAMRDAVAEERQDLTGLARDAQHAIGELNRFRLDENRGADADFPESRFWYLGVLLGLVVIETMLNGVFFGTNVAGGLVGGMTYAVLISIVNVMVLGFLAAAAVRQAHHRDPRRRVAGLVVLVTVAGVALFWNLFVAHYREALPPEYPPDPATLAFDASDSEREIAACWRGPDEADADQEALCLFAANPLGLGGFYSYMLLLIGVAMCAFGAMDWFRMDDPYPGYGRRERHRRKTEEMLSEDRRELLGDLNGIHDEAVEKLRAGFRDPVEARRLALSAFQKLHAGHTDLRSFADDLETSCRGALDIYRTENREARSTDPPPVWEQRWEADWSRPEAPRTSDVMSEEEAEERSREAHAALRERERQLGDCHRECQALVNELTKLDHHDKAVPS